MVNTDTHNSSKAIYCVAAAAKSAAVVAFGGADRAWRLWDRRQSRKEDMVKLLAGLNECVLHDNSSDLWRWDAHVVCLQQSSQSMSLLCTPHLAFINLP